MKSLGEWHAFGSSVLNIVHNQLVLLIMSRQAWFVEGEVVIIIIKKVTRLLLGVNWEKRCWFKLQLFIPWWLKDGNLLFCQPRSQSSSTIPDVKSSVKLNRMRRFGLGTRLFFCCFAVILGNWTKTSSIDYLSRRPSVFEKSKTVSPVVVSSDQKINDSLEWHSLAWPCSQNYVRWCRPCSWHNYWRSFRNIRALRVLYYATFSSTIYLSQNAVEARGGTTIYGLYRYVPLWRIWFWSSLLWDRIYKSESLDLEEGIIFHLNWSIGWRF